MKIWLDQIPSTPLLVECVDCGDPLQPQEVMVIAKAGGFTMPFCDQCFNRQEDEL